MSHAVADPVQRPATPGQRSGLVLPVVMILLGGLLLLQNVGLLPWNLWRNLWRLWPLLLVLVGLELVLGSRLRRPLLALIMAGVALVGMGALVTSMGQAAPANGGRPFEARTFSQPLQGASEAAVTVRFGAGRLRVGTLDGGDLLGQMQYTGPSELQPDQAVRTRGGVTDLEYSLRGRDYDPWPFGAFGALGGRGTAPEMRVQLSPVVPMTLNVQTGAADVDLDLARLRLARLEVQSGASTTRVRLPEQAGSTTVLLQGGVSTWTVEVPPGVAAQIQFVGGLSTLNVDTARFPSIGGQRYRSPDYATAASRVDLSLEVGSATVTVR